MNSAPTIQYLVEKVYKDVRKGIIFGLIVGILALAGGVILGLFVSNWAWFMAIVGGLITVLGFITGTRNYVRRPLHEFCQKYATAQKSPAQIEAEIEEELKSVNIGCVYFGEQYMVVAQSQISVYRLADIETVFHHPVVTQQGAFDWLALQFKNGQTKSACRLEKCEIDAVAKFLNRKTPAVDYTLLIPITEILTNGNATAVAYFEGFVKNCGGPRTDEDDLMLLKYFATDITSETAYDSMNNPYGLGFGLCIDWKAETQDVISGLEAVIRKLGFSLSLKDESLENELKSAESGDDINAVLEVIDMHFKKSGYVLVNLDCYCDNYYLFVVDEENYDKLLELGFKIRFEFHRWVC